MSARMVGRRDEVSRIAEVLAEARAGIGGRIVQLTGEAGIGKSTVVAEVTATATEAGWRVWSVSPTAAEAGLPWTGLAQILRAVHPAELDELSAVQHDRLVAATSSSRTEPVSPELVAFALAALLDGAIGPDVAPLLVIVDDVHWLDPASAGALAYALRGMGRRRAVALLSRRSDELTAIEPERLIDAGAHVTVELGGLGLATLREIITESSGIALGRAELLRIAQRTGGNPLHTAELARAVGAGSSVDIAALPASLRDSVGARVRALPMGTRRILGAVALAVRPTLDLLTTAFTDVDVLEAIGPAEAAGIVEVGGVAPSENSPTIAFCHPLLAAAAIDALTTYERRKIHLSMATTASDVAERATHLMAASVGPDERTAAELELAAHDAHRRGAVDAAAAFARASMDLTPSTAGLLVVLERGYACARYEILAGRYVDADAVLSVVRDIFESAIGRSAVDASERQDMRERLALLESSVATRVHGYPAGEAAALQALGFVTDPARRHGLQSGLVRVVVHQDVRRGVEVAEQAFGERSEHVGPAAVSGRLLLDMAHAVAGDPFDADAWIALVEATDDDTQRRALTFLLVEPLGWSDHPRTIEIAEESLDSELVAGRLPGYLQILHHLTEHLVVRGQWDRVEDFLQQLGEYAGEFADRNYAQASHALLIASRGDPDAADEMLQRVATESESDSALVQMWVRKQAGLVAHALARATAADDLLAVERGYAELGVGAVRWPRFRRDLVEALVSSGRLVEAAAAADRLATDAEHNQVETAVADADAAAAVVAAANGDHDTARDRFAAAAVVQRRYDVRYELARTLLSAGSAARRSKRRKDAGAHLAEARELFDAMGAVTWVRRCDEEAGRLGWQRSTGPGDLTPTELQVVELVLLGMSNSEVAGSMFVSVRTVESHLSRVYRKLDVRSRGTLVAKLTERRSTP